MTDFLDFLPIFSETLARVRARMDADANAGLTSDDADWLDTREGTFYWDVTQVAALEIARLWDALGSETVAAAFPSVAWGDYLDEHASTFGLARNPAIPAEGSVVFAGSADVLIGQGTLVSAIPTDLTGEPVTFQVTQSGTTSAAVPPPTVTATPDTAAGTLPAATYIYHLTSYVEFGESLGSADVPATLTATGRVSLTWSAVAGADGYRIYRTLTVGGQGSLVADVSTTAFMDLGTAAPGVLEPTEDTTSGVLLPVVATDPGTLGNLAANSITNAETVLSGITTITNPEPTTGGEDPEDDDALRGRILAQYAGRGAGAVADYVSWALEYPGVERAVCIPVWAGAGTVLVIPMLADGSPVADSIASGLQVQLDPQPGLGHGQAPIGATVTVQSTTPLDVTIAASISFRSGYSLDGGGGTIATRIEIESVLANYTVSLNPGDTLVYERAQAAFFDVDGVDGVAGLTINSGTADITLATSPPKYAALQTPVLT